MLLKNPGGNGTRTSVETRKLNVPTSVVQADMIDIFGKISDAPKQRLGLSDHINPGLLHPVNQIRGIHCPRQFGQRVENLSTMITQTKVGSQLSCGASTLC